MNVATVRKMIEAKVSLFDAYHAVALGEDTVERESVLYRRMLDATDDMPSYKAAALGVRFERVMKRKAIMAMLDAACPQR